MADIVLQLSIKGMFCRNCPVRIRRRLIYEEGVVNAEVSYEKMSAIRPLSIQYAFFSIESDRF